MKKDRRLEKARDWLEKQGVSIESGFQGVTGDASFRRYFRIKADGISRVLMDAPPPSEDIRPFIDVDQRLRQAGLFAPEIIHADTKYGFMLLEDLGDEMYRGLLNTGTADLHFPALFSVLRDMALKTDASGLPAYEADKLREEMDLFPDWYIDHHRGTRQQGRFAVIWEEFCDHIIASAEDQPQCFVHRDFHSSNLLKTSDDRVGIIDFQDAVKGPVSYDFISLIWDRYLDWPRVRIENWMEDFRQMLGLDIDARRWLRYCDLMGLQRNFKIVGIFSRLYYRDGKNGYIEMIPRFYNYLTSTLGRYPEFESMLDLLEQPECVP